MTHLYKNFGWNILNKSSYLGWRSLLASIAMFAAAVLMSVSAQAQTPPAPTCTSSEANQLFTFAAPNNWPAGSANLNAPFGTGASAITVTGLATLTDAVAGNPTTAASGGFTDTYYYLVDRATAAGSNTVTLTFSKPVRDLRIVVTDIDYFVNGAGNVYQDQATLSGVSPTGAAVVPTAVATSAARVTVAGVTSTAVVGQTNCAATENFCNVTYTYAQPVTSITMTYGNGPAAAGNPANQVIGLAALAFCVQNPDLTLLKDDGGVSFTAGGTGTYTFNVGNVGSAATSGTTTVKDILPAGMSFGTPLTPGGANAAAWTCVRSTTTNANDTATCTSTTPIAAAGSSVFSLPVAVAGTAGGTTLTNRAKVFGGGDPNKVAETSTGTIAACPSDSLAGAVANAGCGVEATPILAAASVVITKTDNKSLAAPGGTNNYVVTLTNQGPSPANGVIVTDLVGAGLTCPATNAVTCAVTGAGAVCPAGPLTVANLTGAGVTVATLPVNGALQFAYTCNAN